MRALKKSLFAGLVGAVVLLAVPASAATIIKQVQVTGGVLNLTTPGADLGTVLAIKLLTGNTYDFEFQTGQTLDVLSQLQASAFGHPAQSLDIGFSLYSGLSGSGTLIDTTAYVVGPSLDAVLAPGHYYLEVASSQINQNKELTSGSVAVAALPEPAAWTMMIFGFGLLGASLRSRRMVSLNA